MEVHAKFLCTACLLLAGENLGHSSGPPAPAGTPQEPISLGGHTKPVLAVAFTPDGRTLISASFDGTINLWDLATRKARATLDADVHLRNMISLTADGRTMATIKREVVSLLDVSIAKEMAAFRQAQDVDAVAISPDGQVLATWGKDKQVKIWDVASRKEKAAFKHAYPVDCAAFSPDGKVLASAASRELEGGVGGFGVFGSVPGEFKLWDIATAKERATLKVDSTLVMSVVFAPDGKTVAFESGTALWGEAKLFDVTTGTLRASLKGTANPLAFSPNSKLLASPELSVELSVDGLVRLWEVGLGTKAIALKGHTKRVDCLAFSPDGKLLATGSRDKTLKLWDVASGKERVTLQNPGDVDSLAFSPDGKSVAAAVASGSEHDGRRVKWKQCEVRVWDLPKLLEKALQK